MDAKHLPLYRVTIERIMEPAPVPSQWNIQQMMHIDCRDTGQCPMTRTWLTPMSPRVSIDVRSGAFELSVGMKRD